MHELVLLKLGGSVLTDKTRPEALNTAVLTRIAGVVAEYRRRPGAPRLLIGHGGGSFGHYWAERYGTQRGAHDREGWIGVSRVSDAMLRLNREVVAALLASGIAAVSVQPSASAFAEGGELRAMSLDALRHWLDAGLVPVVFGDVVADQQQGAAIISTEAVFAYLAPRLGATHIVLVGEEAVYTADPRGDARAERIPLIDASNIADVLHRTGSSHGVDVTGGMASKVKTMWQLATTVHGLVIDLVGPDAHALRVVLDGGSNTTGTRLRNITET
jgi:isopentenyl phosphate kinase